MIKEFGKPYFVLPEPGEFADAFFRLSLREGLKNKIADALKRRAWFHVHDVKLLVRLPHHYVYLWDTAGLIKIYYH